MKKPKWCKYTKPDCSIFGSPFKIERGQCINCSDMIIEDSRKPEWCNDTDFTSCLFLKQRENISIDTCSGCSSFIEKEKVNHPPHYGGGDNPLEVIKIIDYYKLNFNLGCVLKYILRSGKKDGADKITDFEKALWYLNHELELKKNNEEKL